MAENIPDYGGWPPNRQCRGRGVRSLALLPALLGLWLAGCASTPKVERPIDLAACEQLFAAMDEAVAHEGVAWSVASPVPAFPYLRSSRLLASFRDRIHSDAARDEWLERMADLDRRGRDIELRRLSESRRLALGSDPQARLEQCRGELLAHDRHSAGAREALEDVVVVADDYSTGNRVLGLYALTAMPVEAAIEDLHERIRKDFDRPLTQLPVAGKLTRFGPAGELPASPPAPRWQRSALGFPEPDEALLGALFDYHAPIFEIDVAETYDVPGEPYWSRSGKPSVNLARNTAYRFRSWTRWQGQVLLQLNYVIWFSERTEEEPGDIAAGKLDSLIWRVTLDSAGRPLIYDSVHSCGCYQMFFPRPGLRTRPEVMQWDEPPLVPAAAPATRSGQRLVLRVSSGIHYLQRVYGDEARAKHRYHMKDYDELFLIPDHNRRPNGLFRPDGLVPGTERPERFILWPMGVRSAGSMRVYSRMPVAFLGRRHFDDPFWIEELFEGG